MFRDTPFLVLLLVLKTFTLLLVQCSLAQDMVLEILFVQELLFFGGFCKVFCGDPSGWADHLLRYAISLSLSVCP